MKPLLAAVLMFLPGWPLAESTQQLCLCKFVAPTYAPFARQIRLERTFQFAVDFDAAGKTINVTAMEPNQLTDRGDTLRRAAADAISQWTFCPSLAKSDRNEIVVTIRFSLRDVQPTKVDQWSPTDVSFGPPATVEITSTAFTSLQK
jgi:hypothetical protein